MGCMKVSPAVLSVSKMYLEVLTTITYLTITMGFLTSEMFGHVKNLGECDNRWKEWKSTYTNYFLDNCKVTNYEKLTKAIDREFRFWQHFYGDQRKVYGVIYASIAMLTFSVIFMGFSICLQWVFYEAYAVHRSWYRRVDCGVLVVASVLLLGGCLVLVFTDETCSQYEAILERSQLYHEALTESCTVCQRHLTACLPFFKLKYYYGFPHFPGGMTNLFQARRGAGLHIIGLSIKDANKLEDICRHSFNRPILLVGAIFGICILFKLYIMNVFVLSYGLETTSDYDDDEDEDENVDEMDFTNNSSESFEDSSLHIIAYYEPKPRTSRSLI